jgi:hypothetical protein
LCEPPGIVAPLRTERSHDPTEPPTIERGRVTRWLAILLGLGAAALAIWALAVRRGAPPMDDIDAASRQQLEKVLREAEPEPGPSR